MEFSSLRKFRLDTSVVPSPSVCVKKEGFCETEIGNQRIVPEGCIFVTVARAQGYPLRAASPLSFLRVCEKRGFFVRRKYEISVLFERGAFF